MTWRCTCGAVNAEKAHACEACGKDYRPAVTQEAPPAYREMPPRVWQDSTPSDRCTEEGCDKLVRDHIAEFRRYGDRMGLRIVKL